MKRSIAIDTSSSVLGVIALEDGALVHSFDEEGSVRHVEYIVPAIDRLLVQCGWKMSSIDLLAVAAGPGSFTGLRIGTSAAKALSLAWNIPLAYVDTLEALAVTEMMIRAGDLSASPIEWVVPVLDARKGRYYSAVFHLDETGTPVRISEDGDLTPENFSLMLTDAGIQPGAWCAPGPLAGVIAEQLGGVLARADRASAAPGVALCAVRDFDQNRPADAYRGPYYLRSGDIGVRKNSPRFEED